MSEPWLVAIIVEVLVTVISTLVKLGVLDFFGED